MIYANFKNNEARVTTDVVKQWDFGQTLRVTGLTLPSTVVEVHFGIEGEEVSVPMVGVVEGDHMDVELPDGILNQTKKVMAYVYVADVTQGKTVKTIVIPILKRHKPEIPHTPEKSEEFRQAVKRVETVSNSAKESEKKAQTYAEQTKQDAIQTDSDRKAVEELVKQTSNIGAQVEEVKKHAQTASESANNAKLSETNAKTSEDNAKLSETNAGRSAQDAQTASDSAQKSAQTAGEVEGRVSQTEVNIGALVSGFDGKVKEANTALQQAKDGHLEAINTAGTGAVKSVTDTGAEEVKKVQSAGTTETKKVADEGTKQVGLVQKEAQAIVADRQQIQTNKMDIGTLKEDFTKLTPRVNKLEKDVDIANKDIGNINAYLGFYDSDVVGLQVDYKNKSFTRLAGARNLTSGIDFDKFSVFGGRKRCNVADDGTINAWYGDEGFKEDGSNGQVMVYQPKFYYNVTPLELEPIDTGIGYHLRKVNYYISSKPRVGFKLHPAFYGEGGKEVDHVLIGAYEGSIYDSSAQVYLLQDEQVADFTPNTGDKFSSIAGARPATGDSQNLTRPNIEQLSKNRGAGWHLENVKIASMNQLLMMIEYGQMELQKPIGQGIISIPWSTGSDSSSSYAGVTGSTSALGNKTGRAERTTTYEGGVPTEYTVDGKTSVTYRGLENPWGNIWKLVYGVNMWGNGKMDGGQPYICKDFNYSESKNTDNYVGAGFTVTNKGGWISAMAYSTSCDWLFMASECTGNSALPVGDYNWVTENLNGYRIARLGGGWNGGIASGAFGWYLYSGVGTRHRDIGGRLVYVPTSRGGLLNDKA